MPKSFMKYIRHPKKPTTTKDSEKEDERRPWSSKWSKLYSVQPSSSTSYTSAADISSASLLLNFSSGSASTAPSIYLNGNKPYANDQSNGQHSIYMQNNKPRPGYDSFALKQQQKTRFLLPPSKQSNHIHLNGNSTSLSSNHHNGSPLKSAFANADKSADEQHLNGQTAAAKQPQDASSFKKLLPTNSLVARQPAATKPSLIRYQNGSEQSKRQSRPAKVQTTKENSSSEPQDGEASQKKAEPGKHTFGDFCSIFVLKPTEN